MKKSVKTTNSEDVSASKKSRGWLIGGAVGLLIGALYNMRADLILTPPSSYSFNYNPILLIIPVLLGIFFGKLWQSHNKTLIAGLIGGIFSLFVSLNVGDTFSIGNILFEKMIFFPLGKSGLKSFIGFILDIFLFIQWGVISSVGWYLIDKIRK